MSQPDRNCTVLEAQYHIINKYKYNCQNGGYCVFYKPDRYQCQCTPDWEGTICSEFSFSSMAKPEYFAIAGIALIALIAIAVAIVLLVRRHRNRQDDRIADPSQRIILMQDYQDNQPQRPPKAVYNGSITAEAQMKRPNNGANSYI